MTIEIRKHNEILIRNNAGRTVFIIKEVESPTKEDMYRTFCYFQREYLLTSMVDMKEPMP